MRLSATLFTFVLLLGNCTNVLHSQITIIGPLQLGDSSHIVTLKTNRGDAFIGRVMALTPDSVVFKSQGGLVIGFPNPSVLSIERLGQNDSPLIGADVFALHLKKGKVYYGYPTSIKKSRVIFSTQNRGSITKPIRSIERITREYAAVYENAVSPNDFIAKYSKKMGSRGQFLGYNEGTIIHRDEQGREQQIELNEIRNYQLVYPFQDIKGHGRAVMFSPTGFGMSKGELGYRNIMVGLNTLTYGVSDHFSIGVGALSFVPYFDAKVNHSFGEYFHASAGAYLFALFSYGIHGSVSFGKPDYFLNLSYLKSLDNEVIDSDLNFDNWSFGSSIRIGPKTRFFVEYNIVTTPANPFGYDVFNTFGYGNGFSWGFTSYRNKTRWDFGLMSIGPIDTCFPGPCKPSHSPLFFVALGYTFRN